VYLGICKGVLKKGGKGREKRKGGELSMAGVVKGLRRREKTSTRGLKLGECKDSKK
jgi:hypothetical protein